MEPLEYQRLASRTECDQNKSRKRRRECDLVAVNKNIATRLDHAVLGLMGEVGELASNLEKWIFYGGELDCPNLKEEVGDCLWYLALMCNALHIDMGEVMEANIRKLQTRYPDKFSDFLSKEENRDRSKEMEAVLENQEDDGVVYDEEVLARIKSRDRYLCPHCKALVNDEIVMKMNLPKFKGLEFGCPDCNKTFTGFESLIKA